MKMGKKVKILKNLDKTLKFILVGTSHPGNIGASARALKNMGFQNLELVSPVNFPDESAIYRAKAAEDLLKNVVLHKDLYSAVKDCHMVIGASARNRKIPWPAATPRELPRKILEKTSKEQKVAIIFGREDRGLTNEELGLCSLHVCIPTSSVYSSLNLSHAVQIIAYEIRVYFLDKFKPHSIEERDVPLAEIEEVERLIEHFDDLMKEINFYDENNPRQLLRRVRRFFKRSNIDHMEANIFRGVFSSIQKKINKNK